MGIGRGLILFARAITVPMAWGQTSVNTTTESDAEIATYTTTNASAQVNTFQVELKARMQGGSYLFDQTHNAAFGSSTVPAAIAQAAQSFAGPTLLGSNQSTSTSTSTLQTGSIFPRKMSLYGASVNDRMGNARGVS